MGTDPRCERIVGLLADARSRIDMTVLNRADRSLHAMELAERLAARETAVVGVDETNPLVDLVRELRGPRLDHLDYRSDDFRQTFSA